MNGTRASRAQIVLVMLVLLVLHFYVRPRLWDARFSPDFLLLAVVLFAMRSGPGAGAIAGFVAGIVADSLTPARFGAGALAYTMVGYLAAWARAVFFAENLLVNAAFIAVGVWTRDLILLVASGTTRGQLASELFVYAPLQALVTAAFGVAALVVFRQWFSIRLDT